MNFSREIMLKVDKLSPMVRERIKWKNVYIKLRTEPIHIIGPR